MSAPAVDIVFRVKQGELLLDLSDFLFAKVKVKPRKERDDSFFDHPSSCPAASRIFRQWPRESCPFTV